MAGVRDLLWWFLRQRSTTEADPAGGWAEKDSRATGTTFRERDTDATGNTFHYRDGQTTGTTWPR